MSCHIGRMFDPYGCGGSRQNVGGCVVIIHPSREKDRRSFASNSCRLYAWYYDLYDSRKYMHHMMMKPEPFEKEKDVQVCSSCRRVLLAVFVLAGAVRSFQEAIQYLSSSRRHHCSTAKRQGYIGTYTLATGSHHSCFL
jgi:hypothetical protein